MAETVHLPGVGDVKKSYAIGGAVLTAGIVGYAYYRKRQAGNAAASASTSTDTASTSAGIDPATGIPYSEEGIDPTTGLPYSQEGSGIGFSDTGGSYYGSGQITGYDQYGNPIYSTGITGSNIYDTNSAWATQAENDLQAMGVDYATAASAISKVLAGLSVTTAQENLFMEAVGLDGQPPQGYPKPVKVVDSPAQSGSGSGSGGSTGGSTVIVPNETGKSAGQAHNDLVAAGLKPKATGSHQTPNMKVSRTSPSAGSKVTKGTTVEIITSGYVK